VKIIFQNRHLVAADKPGGVLTVPGRMGAADPRPCLGRQLERELRCRLWPVHRLDLEVSGLVLFARDAESHRVASVAFETRRVRKRYQALTEGADRDDARPGARFSWQSLLVRGKKRSFEAPHGKSALTEARLVERVPAAAWVAREDTDDTDAAGEAPGELLRFELEPHTGRAHQLRVHLARAGFPVVGDALYGSRLRFVEAPAIALRSVGIELTDEGDRRALGLPASLGVEGFTSPGPAR
jgi:tRNA pseudouridine32 synthase/23S rRNA pseudouridine746 synthase